MVECGDLNVPAVCAIHLRVKAVSVCGLMFSWTGNTVRKMHATTRISHNTTSSSSLPWSPFSSIDFSSRFPLLLLFLYSVIIIISLCGNFCVCRAAFNYAKNSTYHLIANLAFSDILMTIFNIPVTVIDIILGDWIFGETLCYLLPFLQAVCVYVSSFSMLTIAINRYYLIYYSRQVSTKLFVSRKDCFTTQLSHLSTTNPGTTEHGLFSSHRRSVCHHSSKLFLTITLIWFMAIMHSIPFALTNKVVTFRLGNLAPIRRCSFIAQQPFTELGLTLFVFITQYLIPLVISALIYLRIGFTISGLGQTANNKDNLNRAGDLNTVSSPVVNHSGQAITSVDSSVKQSNKWFVPVFCKSRQQQLNKSPHPGPINRNEIIALRKRSRILLLTLIVSIFAVCWCPFHVYFLLKDFHIIKPNSQLFLKCHWLAMSSVSYNPFVYFWLNEKFRSDTKRLLKMVCQFGKSTGDNTNDNDQDNEQEWFRMDTGTSGTHVPNSPNQTTTNKNKDTDTKNCDDTKLESTSIKSLDGNSN